MVEHDMVEHDDVVSIEHHVRELTEHALETARERAACERAVISARAELEAAERELPSAEREAKERRQSQNDAIRGRAELEHRLAELIEAEDLTRARRQQAEQRAQSFRAAAAFASTGRVEAEATSDAERADRERLVEDRATREAAAAEARATEELAEETKIGRHRAEIETHVDAERALESEIASDRANAEARVASFRETIERTSFAVHEAEVNLARIAADRDRLAEERAAAGQHLKAIGDRARVEIEQRIAMLREQEATLASLRAEQERLLAALVDNERRLEPAPEPEPVDEPVAVAPAETTDEPLETVYERHAQSDEHNGDDPPAPAQAEPGPHFSTVTFTTAPATPRSDAQSRIAEPDYDERGPDFRSLLGNIFTRRKPEEPVLDEGPSISERIARDFGLLGPADEAGDELSAPAKQATESEANAQPPEAHPSEN
jgi:hypothetical protein